MEKRKKESVATAVRLPRETYERLRKKPGGIPDSIKRGLELLAIEEEADEQTREFVLSIFALAREVELETGTPWHRDGGAYRTFRRAITTALAKWRPAGVPDSILDEVELLPFQERSHASHPTNDTNDLGVWIAHDVLETPNAVERARIRVAREKTLKEIVKLQQNRGEDQ